MGTDIHHIARDVRDPRGVYFKLESNRWNERYYSFFSGLCGIRSYGPCVLSPLVIPKGLSRDVKSRVKGNIFNAKDKNGGLISDHYMGYHDHGYINACSITRDSLSKKHRWMVEEVTIDEYLKCYRNNPVNTAIPLYRRPLIHFNKVSWADELDKLDIGMISAKVVHGEIADKVLINSPAMPWDEDYINMFLESVEEIQDRLEHVVINFGFDS